MKRRDFIKAGLSAFAWAGAGTGSILIPRAGHAAVSPRPLPIPPLLENLDKSGQISRYRLSVQQGQSQFFPGIKTPTYGYNGSYLGPTIRVRNGQKFYADINNQLPETTTLHWHGLHVPAQWDGGPRQPIVPGATWSPQFTINQEAATLWYHPHAMGLTGEQVYQGLAGLFIIDDEFSESLKVPKTYGIDDIPVVLQDRRFNADGQFLYAQSMHDVVMGVTGNYLLVNGAIAPEFSATTGLVRLRLLNGSNSSIYRIHFSTTSTFQVIASDGGFLDKPVPLTSIVLSAGERAEILLDLDSVATTGTTLLVDQLGPGRRFEAMRISTRNAISRENASPPASLKTVERIPESEAVKTRTFVMDTMGMGMMGGNRLSINGKKMDLRRIDETVQHNTTEIWEISNRSSMMMSMPHSMHLHDVQFNILDRNGRPPAEHERGRKDTVLIPPGESVRIIIRFGDYRGIYMYHCHLLEHEDDGMMGQFEVI